MPAWPALALEYDLEIDQSDDRLHHAKRLTPAGEHRPLLNVCLDEGGGCRHQPPGARSDRPPGLREGRFHCDALAIGSGERVFTERAGDRAASQKSVAEPPALLIAKRHHRDGAHLPIHDGHRLECSDYAQDSVVATALWHGIEVRSAPDLRRLRPAAQEPAVQVSNGIDTHRQACVLHPATRQPVGLVLEF